MKFDPEYIKLCDDPLIQELRPILEKGDWVVRDDILIDFIITCYDSPYQGIQNFYITNRSRVIHYKRDNCIWLPLPHQIDNRIRKICDDKLWNYDFGYVPKNIFIAQIYVLDDESLGKEDLWVRDPNPLIAKIKLLIQLLKESK